MARSHSLLRRCTVTAALALVAVCGLAAQPTTVYVYNHNPGDVFESNAEGFVWSQLGLLDANGEPIDVPEAQIIRDADDNVIGYRSADGIREAYNVSSSATTDQAWQRVADGGELHIVKHGTEHTGEDGDVLEGGGMLLDGGQPYDGFGTGTGVGWVRDDGTSGPYPLTPRPDAGITLNANGCFTDNDPDDGGAATSVTDSAETVPGVGTAEGHVPRVYARCTVALAGGTAAERQAARTALRNAARQAGYPPPPEGGGERPPTTDQHVADWISSLPFATRYETVQQVLDGAVQPAGTVTLRLQYDKQEAAPTGGGGGGFYHVPRQITPPFYFPVPFLFEDAVPTASIVPLDLPTPVLFDIDLLGELPAPPPTGTRLVSGILRFEALNAPVSGEITLPMLVELVFGFDADPSEVQVLLYEPLAGGWVPPPGSVTLSGTEVRIQTSVMGVYAAFAPQGLPIPTLSRTGLVLLGILLALGAIILARRYAP